uniref:Uncharacterized protein n=1 Tax=Tanacetum cinerariifolium TaxID=118510 RepID=A0A699HTZ9_TANCI|nr:hypothetical protein [Tanacetum cinerariifolium]
MDLFSFIHHANPTKVRIGEREVGEGEVPLLELTRGRVVSLAGVNEQRNQNNNVEGAGNQNDDAGNNVAGEGAADGQGVPGDTGIIRIEDEVPVTIAEKAKVSQKKRKVVGGTSESDHPPKKLREDHDTSGDVGASNGGKSLVVIQELFERSTLNVEIGVTATATVHFVTSYVSLTLELEGWTSRILDPPIMTTAVATTVAANMSSVPVPRVDDELVHASIFAVSATISTVGPDVAGTSQPAGIGLSADSFYVSQDMDSEMLRQIYVPKWNILNECALDDFDMYRSLVDHLAPPVTCLGVEVRMRLEHTLREKKILEGRFSRRADLLK